MSASRVLFIAIFMGALSAGAEPPRARFPMGLWRNDARTSFSGLANEGSDRQRGQQPERPIARGEKGLGNEIRQTPPIVFPLLGPKLSSAYGIRKHPVRKLVRHHGGVDLAAPEKSHVRAVAQGTVIFAGEYAGFGKLVTLRHDKERTSLYGHLSEILVNTGDEVPSGKIIGRVGSTGVSTGPHLHFEWRINEIPVDPLSVFPSLARSADG